MVCMSIAGDISHTTPCFIGKPCLSLPPVILKTWFNQHQLNREDCVPYVTLPFITQTVGSNFVAHAFVHEGAELAVIFDFDQFLRPIGWVRNVDLHLGEGGLSRQDEP